MERSEKAPSFDGAINHIRDSLKEQRRATTIVWIRDENIVEIRGKKYVDIPEPLPKHEAWSRELYEWSLNNGHPVTVTCYCSLEEKSFCFVEVDRGAKKFDTGLLAAETSYAWAGHEEPPRILTKWRVLYESVYAKLFKEEEENAI